MTKKYLFPCSCGKVQEIETSQAGQTIHCDSCGTERKVPSMMKIKDLEPAPTKEQAKIETGNLRRAFFYLGVLLLVPSAIFLALILYYLLYPFYPDLTHPMIERPIYHNVIAKLNYPHPRDVTGKKVFLTFGEKKLYQDSTPLPETERQILWLQKEHFDAMSPIELFYHFQTLGSGPNFSYNFQENYQALKDAYWIRVTTGIVVFVLGLFFLIASFFMPKRNVEVIGWSGTDWR